MPLFRIPFRRRGRREHHLVPRSRDQECLQHIN
jgi:hypothetical protein